MLDTVLSIIVLASVILFVGAWYMFKRGNQKQARLMVLLGFVMVANVVIWLIPMKDGSNAVDAAVFVEE